MKNIFEPTLIPPDHDHERTCGACNQRKSVDEFYKDGKDTAGLPRYRRDCKDCYRKSRLNSRKAKRHKPIDAINPVRQRRRRK